MPFDRSERISSHLSCLTLALFLSLSFALRAWSDDHVMNAHFISVGQANATLLEFSCGAILIDAGAQDNEHVDKLVTYLRSAFQDRPDLNNTLESIIITHNHIDNTRSLRAVVGQFTVNRSIDNGQMTRPGTANPSWVRNNATTDGRNIVIREIENSEITDRPDKNGLTDPIIDPVACEGTDPKITALSGRQSGNPGWSHEDFDNKSNHSIVIRVDFGQASFLFTGGLEETAIEDLLEFYKDTPTLDVDVYEVGHHGSHNGTMQELVDAITPEIAIISVGKWDDGKKSTDRFNAFHYGHPRKIVVDMLGAAIPEQRSKAKRVRVATAAQNFRTYTVRKKIYATGWDGTIKICATFDRDFRVTSED